jgi:transposase
VDRYVAYKSLLLSTNLILQFCWAHVRRDFIAVAKGCSDHEDWTLAWLESIAALYQMNDQRIALLDNPEAFAKADSKLREATDKMKEKRDSELLEQLLHPARRKVLESLENHWLGLLVFVDFPHVPMDNNTAERDVRGPAVGRKNYYGSGAIWSGKLAAIMFALFQTLLLWNINPHSWLTAYLQWCADTGGEALDEGKSYLPWNMSEEQRHSFQLREPKGQDTS